MSSMAAMAVIKPVCTVTNRMGSIDVASSDRDQLTPDNFVDDVVCRSEACAFAQLTKIREQINRAAEYPPSYIPTLL